MGRCGHALIHIVIILQKRQAADLQKQRQRLLAELSHATRVLATQRAKIQEGEIWSWSDSEKVENFCQPAW